MIVDDLFEVKYGTNLELNALELDPSGINFISRTEKNNGVSGRVRTLPDVEPIPPGTITVAASGNSVMESFLQKQPYYSGFHLFVLKSRQPLSDEILLFYCLCLKNNRYKFSYGRQANSTLAKLEIPDLASIPDFVIAFSLTDYRSKLLNCCSFIPESRNTHFLNGLVPLAELFDVYNGVPSSQLKRHKENIDDSYIPYIRPSFRQETSIDGYIDEHSIDIRHIYPPETLYVSTDGQGSHSHSYVSTTDFVPNSNISVLIPNKKMTLSEKIYYSYCITKNRVKFSYGRKPKGNRLKSILLPATAPHFVSDKAIIRVISQWHHNK